jgi:hypothetical protein
MNISSGVTQLVLYHFAMLVMLNDVKHLMVESLRWFAALTMTLIHLRNS